MSHPAGLPDISLDRSLGRIGVPDRLRAAGLPVVTLDQHDGARRGEAVTDVERLRLCDARGWVAFTKDLRIHTREGWAVRKHRVRCFCVHPSKGLSSADLADRFLAHVERITRACARPGPFFYAVPRDGLKWMRLAH